MNSQQLVTYNRPLKLAIIDSGLTQAVIARRARIEHTRFSRIVRGKVAPLPKERRRVAKVLNAHETVLFPVSEASL